MKLNRAGFILTLALGVLAAPHAADAQQPAKVPRIGILHYGLPGASPLLEGFRRGMSELGYVEGQNIVIEYRSYEGRFERIPALAAELVGLKLDLIVASGPQALRAVREASSTIPIVAAVMGDPVELGFAASFAHPGGNITGLSFQRAELSTKRLQLLKEALPKMARVAILWDPTYQPSPDLKATEAAARTLGLRPQILEVRGPEDLEKAFAAARKGRAQALINLPSPFFNAHRARLAELAAKNRLPATSESREFVEAGILMSYGPNLRDMFRRAAAYVDKILKGAKPADLPIEQPMRFELVINLRTAKALGLTIPQAVLFQADELIQ